MTEDAFGKRCTGHRRPWTVKCNMSMDGREQFRKFENEGPSSKIQIRIFKFELSRLKTEAPRF